MAVKQCESWIVRCKVHFCFLISAEHQDILHHSRSAYARQLGEFETVPVKMDRMNVVARIPHTDSVALALFQVKRGGDPFLRHRIRDPIYRPLVEAFFGGVVPWQRL